MLSPAQRVQLAVANVVAAIIESPVLRVNTRQTTLTALWRGSCALANTRQRQPDAAPQVRLCSPCYNSRAAVQPWQHTLLLMLQQCIPCVHRQGAASRCCQLFHNFALILALYGFGMLSKLSSPVMCSPFHDYIALLAACRGML